MKKFYTTLVIILPYFTSGQITSPIIKANFGVDADLRANFFNNLNQAGNDDWFNRPSLGTGRQMIDTSGAAAIVAAYTSNPASRMWSFFRLMEPDPYSVVNNRIVIDAIFHRDFHGTDSTVFAAGSNKNGMSPEFWTCPVAQNIPDKNDILDAMVHVRRAGPNPTDSIWMFGGISIENTTGNRYFDFELYQTDLYYDRTLRRFFNFGPDEGHTSWKFDAAGNILSAGDIIFSAEYGSSSLSNIEARIWIKKTDMSISPVAFNWGGVVDGASSGSQYGYARILPKTAGAFYTGLQSGNGVWAGPFSLVLQDNSVVTSYVARQYMEFSVNLSKLGIDPAMFSTNPCGSPYRRVVIKTRASTSFTAELKDFIAPFSMFDYPTVDAHTDLLYFCESMPETTIAVANPNASSIYTWYTTDGNIVGAADGISINVDMPGTYIVHQQLHALCPVYSQDTVTIMYDSVCTVLQLGFPRTEAIRAGNRNRISWDVMNNHLATYYTIEYSRDNIHFAPVGILPSDPGTTSGQYSYDHNISNGDASSFYRIKGVDANGRFKYSETVVIRPGLPRDIIYPNPTNGDFTIKLLAGMGRKVRISIINAEGRKVSSQEVIVTAGQNRLSANISHLPVGQYTVMVIDKLTSTYRILKF